MENENKLPEDFKAKIKVSEGGCFEWTAGLNDSGYAIVHRKKKHKKVSRLVYQYVNGDVIGNLCVLHRCDNRKCVNPDHLFLGTRGENNTDRKNKGRSNPLRGSKSVLSVLDEVKVLKIRAQLEKGIPGKTIAKKFKTAYTNIWHIKHRKTWKHI